MLLTYAAFWLGLLWLVPLSDDAFMVPLASLERGQITYKMAGKPGASNFLLRMGLFVSRFILFNQASLFRHLRARGILVVTWTLNSDEEWEEAEAIGHIDCMMTDKPSLLLHYCQNSGRSPDQKPPYEALMENGRAINT